MKQRQTRAQLMLLLAALTVPSCGTAHVPLFSGAWPQRSGGIYHQVTRGETLWRIAQQYQVALPELVEANQLKSSDRIKTGQPIWIPGATTQHTVPVKVATETGFIWPVRGHVVTHFGVMHDGSATRGIDIHAASGTAVRAARSGRVVFIDRAMPGYGQAIILDHGDTFHTVYTWNGELLVQLGQYVTQTTPIATAGSTGRAPGAAIHFEIRRHHVPQNPLHFLP